MYKTEVIPESCQILYLKVKAQDGERARVDPRNKQSLKNENKK